MSIQINLQSASSCESLRALAEVSDFDSTDMGRRGPQRWTYRVLEEPSLTEQLKQLANPQSRATIDSVTLQPCTSYRSQDRYSVEQWPLFDGTWTFMAVFDGHVNDETVQHVLETLPSNIRKNLDGHLCAFPGQDTTTDVISNLLNEEIVKLDRTFVSDLTQLFHDGYLSVNGFSDEISIKSIVNDPLTGEGCHQKISQALGGCTVLLALIDAKEENLWLANLGDSYAVLGHRSEDAGNWRGALLNSIHNGSNADEISRIKNEHPNENTCSHNNRVAGFLAPTRTIGDAWLKIPADHTRQILSVMEADWLEPYQLREYLPNVLTPPYVSNHPDVYHHRLPKGDSGPKFLILSSDGLSDLYGGRFEEELVDDWARVVGQELDLSATEARAPENLALSLLRDALGGVDTQLVSRNLTVEMEEKWMDDTTIVVMRFL